MSRARSPNREKAFEIYREHQGKITSKEIANMLGEKEKNIEYWRNVDDWKGRYKPQGGAPKGNTNAVGHKGVTPLENQNARTYGWYSKYLPTEVRNLIKEAEEAGGSPLDIQWAMIMTKWINILRSQKIMYVKDENDKSKELKKFKSQQDLKGSKDNKVLVETYREEEYEIQQAWDRQANLLNSQSRAMATLSKLIKDYNEMLHANWDIATEEQKLRVERLKAQIQNPELQHRKEHDAKKLQLDRERFEHTKKMDESKVW
ncbi:uncharacterized protein YjcR [Anaerosolibacter carboniphilus]|uniref:Uncharacterized protein YjcR n=1 Tax=Anaerosolibacter carboniphilus TaxID=1417629 RepID=A0A841KWX5_9FIRM|nr:phage terminase small subunit [Anaerosolibacter carboniphilus]MBB6218196.1 uncharacterized protein YjcR [Anaerosolibacter carboniphilus]